LRVSFVALMVIIVTCSHLNVKRNNRSILDTERIPSTTGYN